PEQHEVHRGVVEWFTSVYPTFHPGPRCELTSRCHAAIWTLLRHPAINFDLAGAQAAVSEMLCDDDAFGREGHLLSIFSVPKFRQNYVTSACKRKRGGPG